MDVLKLDRSLIQNIKPNQENNILNLCAQLTKMMHLSFLAEGVETKEQLQKLQDLGCDYIQGYYFSKSLSVEDFETYLLTNI